MELVQHLTEPEREIFFGLTTPIEIQNFLDSLPYIGEDLNRPPVRVIRDRQCHCLDGGLFAAAALRWLGYPPLILDLVPEPGTDDDHVLAIFKKNNLYGAIAKSNFVGLRFREPVYRSLRELTMSYFEGFYNINGLKTLRAYTRPLNLSTFDHTMWTTTEQGVATVVKRFYSLAQIQLLSADSIAGLSPIDRRSYEAGILGTNYDGLYKPAVSL